MGNPSGCSSTVPVHRYYNGENNIRGTQYSTSFNIKTSNLYFFLLSVSALCSFCHYNRFIVRVRLIQLKLSNILLIIIPDYKSKLQSECQAGLPVSAAACVILPRGEYFASEDAGAFTVWDTASVVYIIQNSAWQ